MNKLDLPEEAQVYTGDIEYWNCPEELTNNKIGNTLNMIERHASKFINEGEVVKKFYLAYFDFDADIRSIVYRLPTVQLKDLPHESGIYLCIDQANNVTYIGQSTDLANRWKGRGGLGQYESIGIKYFLCDDLDVVESLLISIFEPPYNRQNREYWPGRLALLRRCYDWIMSSSRVIER